MQVPTLHNASYYRPAVLWLIGQLKEARRSKIFEGFLVRLGHLIPENDYKQDSTGNPKWRDNISWAGHDLKERRLLWNES